jgi:hypothetical protein
MDRQELQNFHLPELVWVEAQPVTPIERDGVSTMSQAYIN